MAFTALRSATAEGVATIAYDQRGFGRSPQRGIWPGKDLMVEDLRTVVALARGGPGAEQLLATADGRLLVRNLREMAAFDIRPQ